MKSKKNGANLAILRRCFMHLKRVIILSLAIILSAGPVLILNQTVSAAQITNRSVTISSAVPSATATYAFSFKNATTGVIEALSFQACTTPLGTCTTPTGFNIYNSGSASLPAGAFTGFGTTTSPTQITTATTPNYTNATACNTANVYCITWTGGSSITAGTTLGVTFTSGTNNVVNPSTANTAFYIRINDWATNSVTGTVEDSGSVAASTSQTFTVNATIQEYLLFCVGAVAGSTYESVTGAVPACGSITGSSLNLGVLSPSYTAVSPENVAGSNGDNSQGVAELSSNAGNGTVISYNSIQQSGSGSLGTLRVPGATCSGTAPINQCINDSSGGTAITKGTEDWGMAIPGINCNNVSAYTCNATTHNLVVQSPYYCTSSDATTSFTTFDTGGQNTGSGATNCNYAWDDSGGSDPIATSAGSSSKVVGGEALLLEFAATVALTTPTGVYQAQANFVATPTY